MLAARFIESRKILTPLHFMLNPFDTECESTNFSSLQQLNFSLQPPVVALAVCNVAILECVYMRA